MGFGRSGHIKIQECAVVNSSFFSGIFLILLLFLFNIRVNGENDQNCHPCSSNRYSIVARGEDECKPQ